MATADAQYPLAKEFPAASRENPYLGMFGYFRDELDEHHDRRERVIKTSRDITALSKKMYQTRSCYFGHKHLLKLVWSSQDLYSPTVSRHIASHPSRIC